MELVIGNLYEVISEYSGHGFEIGDVVRYVGGHDNDKFEYLDGSDYWYICPESVHLNLVSYKEQENTVKLEKIDGEYPTHRIRITVPALDGDDTCVIVGKEYDAIASQYYDGYWVIINEQGRRQAHPKTLAIDITNGELASQSASKQSEHALGMLTPEDEYVLPKTFKTQVNSVTAASLLQRAAELQEERGMQYDNGKERSAAKVAQAFNAITGKDLSEEDVWMLLVVLKQVRYYSNESAKHRDSVEDLISYAALFGESALKDTSR